jgi:lysozyme
MLKVLNSGDYDGVPEQIKRWNKAGGKVLEGLIRRREAEALLFQGKKWDEV